MFHLAADGETGALTSGLEPGITEEDKYFKADIDGIVQKIQKDNNKVGRYMRDLAFKLYL